MGRKAANILQELNQSTSKIDQENEEKDQLATTTKPFFPSSLYPISSSFPPPPINSPVRTSLERSQEVGRPPSSSTMSEWALKGVCLPTLISIDALLVLWDVLLLSTPSSQVSQQHHPHPFSPHLIPSLMAYLFKKLDQQSTESDKLEEGDVVQIIQQSL